MLNFIPANENATYAQEIQTHSISFTFVNKVQDSVHGIFSPVICRDFLGDVLYAEFFKETVSIYGFQYNPQYKHIDRDKLRLVIQGIAKHLDTIQANLQIIHNIEDMHGLEKTTISRINHTTALLEADPKWLLTIYLISYYTYIIKCMSYEFNSIKDWELKLPHGTEKSRIEVSTIPVFRHFTKNLFKILEPYSNPSGYNFGKENSATKIIYIHNYNGFVNTMKGLMSAYKNVYKERFENALKTM